MWDFLRKFYIKHCQCHEGTLVDLIYFYVFRLLLGLRGPLIANRPLRLSQKSLRFFISTGTILRGLVILYNEIGSTPGHDPLQVFEYSLTATMNRGSGTAERSEPPTERVRTPRQEDFPEDLLQPPRANGYSPEELVAATTKVWILDCPKLVQTPTSSTRRTTEAFEEELNCSRDNVIEEVLTPPSRVRFS